MKLNKNSSYVLLSLLSGCTNTSEIAGKLPAVEIRSIQRSLVKLVELGLTVRTGVNNPTYQISYQKLLTVSVSTKLLEDEKRPNTTLNHSLLEWLSSKSGAELDSMFIATPISLSKATKHRMSMKELEHLTIELSWRSSSFEGNTYTLLDTQLLIAEGIKAKNRTEFETQMILNHKNAVAFIVENSELFNDHLEFRTVEELHKIIGFNLGIDKGIRKRLVRISASNYEPIANPHQLKEAVERVLSVVNKASSPFTKALLLLALIPYLQVFEDGNKRTGRMLANAILISLTGTGFSLRKTEARELALAYLAFYEFNSIASIQKILQNELK